MIDSDALNQFQPQNLHAMTALEESGLSYVPFASDSASNYANDAAFRANIFSGLATYSNPALAGTGSLSSLYGDGRYPDLVTLTTVGGTPAWLLSLPPSTDATPILRVGFPPGKERVWVRRKIRFKNGFTTVGNNGAGAKAYKLSPDIMFAGTNGRGDFSISNTTQYTTESYPIISGTTVATQFPGGGGPQIVNEWTDEEDYEYRVLYERINDRNIRWRTWKITPDNSTIELGDVTVQVYPTVPAPYVAGTSVFGENYNQVRTALQDLVIWMYFWEAVDADEYPDPWDMIGGSLTPSLSVPVPALTLASKTTTQFVINVPIPNPAPPYMRFMEGATVLSPREILNLFTAINPAWAGTTRQFTVTGSSGWTTGTSHTVRAQFVETVPDPTTGGYVNAVDSNAITDTLA